MSAAGQNDAKTAQEPAAGATFACHVAIIAGDGRD